MHSDDFTDDQKRYLEGFAAGSGLARSMSLAVLPSFGLTPGVVPQQTAARPADDDRPIDVHRAAQDRFLANGRKLAAEEKAKRAKDGLAMWDEIVAHARDGRFPRGTDVFLFKFSGMFYVAPAQDAFMCRLRFPGGMTNSAQFRGVADLAERFAGGYADVTTRANLQLRQIGAKQTVDVLMGLAELGIVNRGAGADNIRNVTASPTAGIDPQELIDTRPLAREMHHYVLNHREMYGLPRKFNIAFDGGGAVSALEDTNDVGFAAVRVGAGHGGVEPGVYFRLTLGGITGHKDFARDTGVMLKEDECVPVAAAIVRVFTDHGDRTDRKKARLKYVLDAWGFEKFLAEAEKLLPFKLRRFPLEQCEPRPAVARAGHIGVHPQKQDGLSYVGVVLPVGRLTAAQMRGLAKIADAYGSGAIRLTVWQNLLISDVPNEKLDALRGEIEALGLHQRATEIRAGLVACTGNAGCKYAASNTKAHAMLLASYLEPRLTLDVPVNIHLTGCHHSCAQHYIGDIGMLATKVSVGEEVVEGYHVYVGGGYGAAQDIGRELYRDVRATDLPPLIERILRAYLAHRAEDDETFRDFVKRHPTEDLKTMFDNTMVTA